jgi:probable rRNA maturation factor
MNLDRHDEKHLVIVPKRIPGLSAATLERFVLKARRVARVRGTVNVLVTGNNELRSLNHRFRKKNKATDVLSFPAPPGSCNGSKPFAGDLAISADIARDNAIRLGHSLAAEIKILTLHGILHLAGFDHEQDEGQMARKESLLRRQLRLEIGLIERSNGASARRRSA